jgi:uncharacterized protein YbbC (DUF1343 family)
MNERALPGVRFEAVTLSVLPTARKYPGQSFPGVRFVITDRQSYRPVRTALLLIDEIRRRHPNEFKWTGTIDRLTGSAKVREAIDAGTLPAVLEAWDRQAEQWLVSRAPYLLYR